MSFFHCSDTEAPNVTFPAVSHAMLPEAICPEPSLFSFHFVELMIEPVAAQRHVALANGSRVDRPAGYAVARTQLCHAVPCTVRGIEPEVRVAVVVELHPLPASDTRIGPVHRDASVAAVYRDMRGSEGRSPDHPAADFSFGEGTASGR